jgi:hypothetical protein
MDLYQNLDQQTPLILGVLQGDPYIVQLNS